MPGELFYTESIVLGTECVCVCSPPNPYAETLSPMWWCFEIGHWEVIKSWGLEPSWWESAWFLSQLPFFQVSIEQECLHLCTRRKALIRTWPGCHPDLRLPSPELWEINSCCLNHPVCSFLITSVQTDLNSDQEKILWKGLLSQKLVWSEGISHVKI
jgi:hypothetical protein